MSKGSKFYIKFTSVRRSAKSILVQDYLHLLVSFKFSNEIPMLFFLQHLKGPQIYGFIQHNMSEYHLAI